MSVILRLQNLPLSANAAHIRAFFQGLKIPDGGVNIVGGEDGDAFIVFATDDDARQAMFLSGQEINNSPVKLLLSSKQEMQRTISEAQSRVLKRSNVSINETVHENQTDKRSYTYFNPNFIGKRDSCESLPAGKMRIIDYSQSFGDHSHSRNDNFKMNDLKKDNYVYDDPIRPSEFSYKTSKSSLLRNEPSKDKFRYGYEDSDNYNYDNDYDDYTGRDECYSTFRTDSFNSDSMNNYETPKNNGYNDEPFYENVNPNNRRSLLPTPVSNETYRGSLKRPLMHAGQIHNYSERPPWLESSKAALMSPISTVIRLTLPLSLLSFRTIFEIFKGISIVPKKGIRIEKDEDKRSTGYVYVKFVNNLEVSKALKLNGRMYKSITLVIESVPDSDFNLIEETGIFVFQPDIPFRKLPPVYRDCYIELSKIPKDVTEEELRGFFNIKLENNRFSFMEHNDNFICLIDAGDENTMLAILKSRSNPFKGNSIKAIAISRTQYRSISAGGKKEFRSNAPKPLIAAQKYLAESSKMPMTCARISNLREGITPAALCAQFSPSIIPISNVVIRGTEAVVDFISAATSQKIMNDLKNKTNVDFTITPINSTEFNRLKSSFHNQGNVAAVRSVASTNASHLQPSKATVTGVEVKLRNLSTSAGNMQLKDLIKDFQYQPLSIKVCFVAGRHQGEAVVTFRNAVEAVAFKDEYHGIKFMQKELEVILSENDN